MNNYLLTFLLIIALFTGCTSSIKSTEKGLSEEELLENTLDGELETAAITNVAFGERVKISLSSGVPSKVRKVRVISKQGAVVIKTKNVNFWRRSKGIIFDLPKPFGTLPDLGKNYNDIDNRGRVVVRLLDSSNALIKRRIYEPFGAVVSGEVNVLLSVSDLSQCTNLKLKQLFPWASLNKDQVSGADNQCYATLGIGGRSTQQALSALKKNVNTLVVSRNIVSSLDHRRGGGRNSLDPTCEQIETWLSPVASNFQTLDTDSLLTRINVYTAHTSGIGGNGVTVAIIGGGVRKSALSLPAQTRLQKGYNFLDFNTMIDDEYHCDLDRDGADDFIGHDTHIAQIIHDIAPKASIIPLMVCDTDGSCDSGDIVKALFYLKNLPVGKMVVNMSLGGPLEDEVLAKILSDEIAIFNAGGGKFLFSGSAGNHDKMDVHFPIDSMSDIEETNNLHPIGLVVQAEGLNNSGLWQSAPFNRSLTLSWGRQPLIAPGVNLCPSSAELLCDTGYPGLIGTSFSAPIATGIAALYAQEEGLDLKKTYFRFSTAGGFARYVPAP